MSTIKVNKQTSFSIKAIALLMSFFYLLSPIHSDVNKVLHKIVHAVEMPETIISHQKKLNNYAVHKEKKHKNTVNQHKHNIIEFVVSILETNKNEERKQDTFLSKFKIKKHIKNHQFAIDKKIILVQKQNQFKKTNNKLCKGYLTYLKKPPKA